MSCKNKGEVRLKTGNVEKFGKAVILDVNIAVDLTAGVLLRLAAQEMQDSSSRSSH